MRPITKRIFLTALACPTLGWLMRQDQIHNTITAADRFMIEQGQEIGKRARALHPEGTLIATRDFHSAVTATQNLMNDPNTQTLFEPAFLTDDFATRADILTRKPDGSWHMTEVKASTNDKAEFIDDMAYTTLVIERTGFNISEISLLLISKEYRLGMPPENLFVERNHTEEVKTRIEELKPICTELEALTRTPKKPEPELRLECRGCDLFKDCTGKGITNHIFDLPRLNQVLFDALTAAGILCIEDIPPGFSLTGNQNRVKMCVQTNKPQIEVRLKPDLEAVSWPAFYLDFETVMTAIPLYPNLAPYAQLPTQYSIHKCSEPGHVTAHSEYLADPSRDCRLELAERLIADLKGAGSIIVYTSFEKTIINGLARLYHDLAADLNLLIGRLVDLEAIIKKNFYHPGFHGRTSIKRTLPILVPEMSYDGLDIGDGFTAMSVFALMAFGKYEVDEAETLKKQLLVYCKQDTLAMVKLHEQLVAYV